MLEQEMLARLTALETEIATMKAAKYENLKEQAAQRISDKYRLSDDYELLLESAARHIEVGDTDTLGDVAARLEEELKTVCKRAGKEEPADCVGMVTKWAQERDRIEASNVEFSKAIESKIYRGTV